MKLNRMASLKEIDRNVLTNMAAFIIVIAGIKTASVLIVPFLLALFLTVICMPLFALFRNKGIPQSLSLLLIVALVVGIWALFIYLLGTTLGGFTTNVPLYQERLRIIIGECWSWFAGYGITLDKSLFDDIFDPGRIMRLITGMLNSLVGILKNVFLVLLIFVFLLIEVSTGMPYKIRAIGDDRKNALGIFGAIVKGVNRFFTIKSITSCATGVFVYLFLKLEGIDFPALWGMLACILNFIPNIGSLIAAVPPVLLALVQFGPGQAVITAIAFLVVNTVVGNIIEPKVMGRGVGLSTLVVLLSLVFWGWVLGPVGMFLSVPLTMAAKIAFAEQESTRWVSILLGSDKDVVEYLQRNKNINNSKLL